MVDRLDDASFMYHHEGPYDAANISRNLDWKYSPIAAVHDSNEEALRATPRENIIDAITKHRPLEGVAVVPPGVPDRFGRVLNYEEGADLQRERGGDYRRWPGVVSLIMSFTAWLLLSDFRNIFPVISKAKANLPTLLRKLSRITKREENRALKCSPAAVTTA